MTEDTQLVSMQKEMRKADRLVEKSNSEVLVYMLDKIADELERRSQRHIEYHRNRMKRINNQY